MPVNTVGTNEKQIRITTASMDKEEAEKITRLIRKMLDKSDTDLFKSSICELVKAGSITQAYTLAADHYNINFIEARKYVDSMKNEPDV